MAVADRGQRLHTEEETIQKPLVGRCAGDAVVIETIYEREKKIQRHVNNCDEDRELRPAQTEEPAINIAPLIFSGVDLDELDGARLD